MLHHEFAHDPVCVLDSGKSEAQEPPVLVLPTGWKELDLTPVPSRPLGWLSPRREQLRLHLELLPLVLGALVGVACSVGKSVLRAIVHWR